MKLTVLYEFREARDTASRSGMELGMAAGYDRLEQVLASVANLSSTSSPGRSTLCDE